MEINKEHWYTIQTTRLGDDDWCESGYGQFNFPANAAYKIRALRRAVDGFDFRIVRHTHIEELVAEGGEMNTERIQELEAALRVIVELGGNLPDDRLTTRTGPNDAAQRGIMYCAARSIALRALEASNGAPRS